MLEEHRFLTAFAAAALCAPLWANAQNDETFDRTPEPCIIVSRIDDTDVIDDRTIIFFMRGKRIYRNYLPQRCPRLEIEDRFGYRVTGARVCKSDTLTVLPRVGLPTYCELGEFQPITAEEVEELRAIHEGEAVDGIESKPAEATDDPSPAGDDAAEPESTDPPR